MTNIRFIESEIKKSEQEHEKLKTRIFSQKSDHSRKKDDATRAKRDVEDHTLVVRRLEEQKTEQERAYFELERKLQQLKSDNERAARTLADEKKIHDSAEKRLARANLAFDTIDRELGDSIRKEREFQQTVMKLRKEMEKLGDTIKHGS